jgi:hypothetical protein
MNVPRLSLVIAALALALGPLGGGYFIGKGIGNRDQGRRSISVKGLSEKEFPASIAIWTLAYGAAGNDLGAINTKLTESTKAVRAFLQDSGFDDKDVAVQPPSVHDLSLQHRDKDSPAPAEKYSATQSVLLRTTKVDAIKPAMASASKLMESGVLLHAGHPPEYLFSQLNEVKPGMIQEATKNARIAADQFARDSETALGKLRSASQGWFQVENRDSATPERKLVRVVVEVEYEIN